jgi:hypothetical protein
MIRHGEKPPKIDGKDQDGLSDAGIKRAQGLRTVFGGASEYNIQYILAEHPKKSQFASYESIMSILANGRINTGFQIVTALLTLS